MKQTAQIIVSGVTLRPIRAGDNPSLAALIRTVMPEFGATGEGYAIADPEVDSMFETYSKPRSRYFVIEEAGRVLGGGGVAPLKGGEEHTCELQKMYFLPALRGRGMGKELLTICLETARELEYQRIYAETLARMPVARALYERFGFAPLEAPLGNTGHHKCDRWYVKPLE